MHLQFRTFDPVFLFYSRRLVYIHGNLLSFTLLPPRLLSLATSQKFIVNIDYSHVVPFNPVLQVSFQWCLSLDSKLPNQRRLDDRSQPICVDPYTSIYFDASPFLTFYLTCCELHQYSLESYCASPALCGFCNFLPFLHALLVADQAAARIWSYLMTFVNNSSPISLSASRYALPSLQISANFSLNPLCLCLICSFSSFFTAMSSTNWRLWFLETQL